MSKVELSVELAGVKLKNPIVVASGTFGFGREYGQCEQWRVIANANQIENPRLLDTGSMIKLPALK